MTEPLVAAERENNNESRFYYNESSTAAHSQWASVELAVSQFLFLILLYGNISCMSLFSDLQIYIFQDIYYIDV